MAHADEVTLPAWAKELRFGRLPLCLSTKEQQSPKSSQEETDRCRLGNTAWWRHKDRAPTGPQEINLVKPVAENVCRIEVPSVKSQVFVTSIAVALELLANGTWSGAGVLGPEAFDAVPFLDLLKDYGSPWGIREGG